MLYIIFVSDIMVLKILNVISGNYAGLLDFCIRTCICQVVVSSAQRRVVAGPTHSTLGQHWGGAGRRPAACVLRIRW